MNNTIISVFENVKNSRTPIRRATLWDMITTTDYSDIVEVYRSLDKSDPKAINIKERVLPAFTASGEFTIRCKDGMVRHSGYICLDFDNVDETQTLIEQLSKMEFIAFASLSVGGRGVFALVKVADKAKHHDYFCTLRTHFANLNIEIDRSCSDVSRLRVVSYDPNPYINTDAKVWDKLPKPRCKKQVTPLYNVSSNNEERLFLAGVKYIEQHGIDITQGYSTWLSLASCIKTLFGERGRDYFHRISQFHPYYNEQQSNTRWQSCKGSGYPLGVFAKACSRAGIPKLKELL